MVYRVLSLSPSALMLNHKEGTLFASTRSQPGYGHPAEYINHADTHTHKHNKQAHAHPHHPFMYIPLGRKGKQLVQHHETQPEPTPSSLPSKQTPTSWYHTRGGSTPHSALNSLSLWPATSIAIPSHPAPPHSSHTAWE